MHNDLSGLTALLAVAEKRSFTAAARVLGITPSAVSQAVSALEGRLGVRLVQRTTRSVGLTEAGQHFVARLEPALKDVNAAFDALNALRERPAGTLRLNLSRAASQRVIEPGLVEFLGSYPEIRLEMTLDDGLTDIVAQGFDAGIRLGETLERDMIAVRISDEERAAVVGAPAYFAERKKPKHPRDLLDHDCINFRLVTRGALYRWEFSEAGKDFEIAVSGRLVANDGDFMLRAALAGAGLAYLLENTVRDLVREKRLVRVLEGFCPPFPGFFLYYPSRSQLPPKLEALVEFLKKKRERIRRG